MKLYVTSETSDIYPQNTHPVVKRLNKTSNLHPLNVQYSLFDTEKKKKLGLSSMQKSSAHMSSIFPPNGGTK